LTPARDQQIRALYQAALERPPTERASFVAALTGDDAELRKSVELLLSNQGETDLGARVAAASEPAAELAAGTSFGQYHIDGVLGRGGIGVVYRATDTKLHRPVAIKFLSAAVADADVRRRFKQEAETTSSLNHPHIVTVYDVGEHDGREYIVSELVDGGTLDDWAVKTRKRSWRQSVELLTGVADALAAAHAAGVLHRDVKPGNILIGSNGYAKLADFGLAKLVDDGPSGSLQRTATRSGANNTRAGVVVGTIAYMSPEQAAGLALDARSDVFSFGVVLYELVAGRRPFEGANDLETLKSIAHAAPAPLPDDSPELLKITLEKALEKEPSDRYQTMQDLVADLKRVTRKGAASQSGFATPVKAQRRVLGVWAGAIGVALGAALALGAVELLRAPAPPAPQIRFTISAPGYVLGGMSVSPDGRQITYASNVGGTPQIWLRPIDTLDARPVPGTENGGGPFWSPDSRHLVFGASDRLKKIDVAGGPAQTITDKGTVMSGSWGPNDTILFTNRLGTFARVSPAGGPVTELLATKNLAALPQALPDAKHFLYVDPSVQMKATIFIGSLSNALPTPLVQVEFHDVPGRGTVPHLAYTNDHLLLLLDGTLLAWPFDARKPAVRGEAIAVAENVAEFAVSDTGMLVYHEKAGVRSTFGLSLLNFRPRRLVWFDRDGKDAGTVETPPGYHLPVLSPDGHKVAVSAPAANGINDMWVIDTQRGITSRLTFSAHETGLSVWSPDSAQIAFSGITSGFPSSIYKHAANGSGSEELLSTGAPDELALPFDWTANGLILFGRLQLATPAQTDIWALPTGGGATPYPVLQTPFNKAGAKVSPNGKWIVYTSNESGMTQVNVEPFPALGQGKWQVSTRGGISPKWRSDGRELYYLALDGNVMAVDVDTSKDAFESGSPRALFSTPMEMPTSDEQPDTLFDASPDGQRFLLNLPLPRENSAAAFADTPLQVIVNWTAGLGKP
jgi:serine/threonine protein kinase/Tol biopolymer transport system component